MGQGADRAPHDLFDLAPAACCDYAKDAAHIFNPDHPGTELSPELDLEGNLLARQFGFEPKESPEPSLP